MNNWTLVPHCGVLIIPLPCINFQNSLCIVVSSYFLSYADSPKSYILSVVLSHLVSSAYFVKKSLCSVVSVVETLILVPTIITPSWLKDPIILLFFHAHFWPWGSLRKCFPFFSNPLFGIHTKKHKTCCCNHLVIFALTLITILYPQPCISTCSIHSPLNINCNLGTCGLPWGH